MLRTAESNIKGWIQIHSIESAKQRERKVIKSKVNGKTKNQRKNGLKPYRDISKDGKCFHYESLVIGKETALFFLERVKKAKSS